MVHNMDKKALKRRWVTPKFSEGAKVDHKNVLNVEKKHNFKVYQFTSDYYNGLDINGNMRQMEFDGDYQGTLIQEKFVPKGIPMSIHQAAGRTGYDIMEKPSPFVHSWADIHSSKPMLWYLKPQSKICRWKYNYKPGTRFVSSKHLKDLLSASFFEADTAAFMLDLTWKLEKQRDLMEFFGNVNFSRTFNRLVRSIKLRRRTEENPNDSKLQEWLRYRKLIDRLKVKFNTWENWKDKVGYYDQNVMLKNHDYSAIKWDTLINLQECYCRITDWDRVEGYAYFRTMPNFATEEGEVSRGKIHQVTTRKLVLYNRNDYRADQFTTNLIPWEWHTTFFMEADWGFRTPARIFNADQSRMNHRHDMDDAKTMKHTVGEIIKHHKRKAHWQRIDRQAELDKQKKPSKEFTHRMWDSENWRFPEIKPANLFNWNKTDDEKVTEEHDNWKRDLWLSPKENRWDWEEEHYDDSLDLLDVPLEYVDTFDEKLHSSARNLKHYRELHLHRHWRWANPYWWGNYFFMELYYKPWLLTGPSYQAETKLKNPKGVDIFWFKFSHIEKIWLHRADATPVQYKNVGSVNGLDYRYFERYFDKIWDSTHTLLQALSNNDTELLTRELYNSYGQKVLKHKYSNRYEGGDNPLLRYYTYDGPNFFITNWSYIDYPDPGIMRCLRPKYMGPWHIPVRVRNMLEYEVMASGLSDMVRGTWWIPGLSMKYFIGLNYYFQLVFMIFFTIAFFFIYFLVLNPEVGDKRWTFGYKVPKWYTKGWASYVKDKAPGEMHTSVKKWFPDPTGKAPARHRFNWYIFNLLNIPICIIATPFIHPFCSSFHYTNIMNYLIFFSSATFAYLVRVSVIEAFAYINKWSELNISPAEYDIIWQKEMMKTQFAEARRLHLEAKALKAAGLFYNSDHIDNWRFRNDEGVLPKIRSIRRRRREKDIWDDDFYL